MAPATNVLQASISASVELLVLSAAGAFLAHNSLLNSSVSSSLSKALYNLFIPCLVFGSVLDTAHRTIVTVKVHANDTTVLQDLWVPVALAFSVFLITLLIALPVTALVAARKEVAVRRAMFLCAMLGNSNTMPLLVMQSLCHSFTPLRDNNRCYATGVEYASLYMTVVNMVAWTALFQYIMFSPDSSLSVADEGQSMLESGIWTQYGTVGPDKDIEEPLEDNRLREALKRSFLSPPFLTVLGAIALAFIPKLPQAFLSQSGFLYPVTLSVNTIGQVVVPVSCMIVGAELYRSFSKSSSEKDTDMYPEETFGMYSLIAIVLVRMLLLPYIGRQLYKFLDLARGISSPELRIFVLSQWNVPTANNAVIIMSIAAESLPRIGKRLREDVSKCVFWQFLLTPLFLSLNTAAALNLVFPSS